ncbi:MULTISPECIES: hypothetical protein [Muribaculaceae]|uniref:hypothetical protein n=1 Tax=Muribaculaceae TaxID=2005473 RepID=UPI0025829185|nr:MULTISPECIES: hypothetical protein [Muribaculaceae]
MRFKVLILMLLSSISIVAQGASNNWQKQYMADEFGDADYSKPMYQLIVDPIGGYGASVEFNYIQGLFIVSFRDAFEGLDDIKSLKVKSSSGQVYDLKYDLISREPSMYGIQKESSDVLLRLLEQGNFTISVKTPVPFSYGETHNHAFKIGTQGQGISKLTGNKASVSGKLTFKGKTGGKYSITVQFDQPESVFENGGTLTGTYWYGNGTNGKMKLKGSVDGLGRIDMEEYDSQGKKCGDWFLNTLSSDDGMKYALDGVMTNAKDQTFNVSLTQQ